MANYTNATNVSTFLQRALSTNESAALTAYILNAVDKWINRKLESRFDDVAASTRYFDGGGHSIDIDPVQSITSVQALNNDGSSAYTYDDLSLYVAEPVNDTIKREIRPRGSFRFPRGAKRIAITGRFTEYDYANSTVPEDIIMAATRLAAGILMAGKITGQGNVAREELEGHRIMYQVNANALGDLADADPIIQGMIGERRELFIYSDESDRYDNDMDIL